MLIFETIKLQSVEFTLGGAECMACIADAFGSREPLASRQSICTILGWVIAGPCQDKRDAKDKIFALQSKPRTQKRSGYLKYQP